MGAGSPGPQFSHRDTKHYGDVCLCQAQVTSHSFLLLAFLLTPAQALGFLLAVLTGPLIRDLGDAESDLLPALRHGAELPCVTSCSLPNCPRLQALLAAGWRNRGWEGI